ncbi:ISAs1 family transposase [Laspinema sp. D1]|uniref:ISAs1 family transposase n=1 Tax=Laspinema palackyanum D2a TaxID=2953684 RepID=A0ABT2MLQ2_9CYAN|nr:MULTISPECIES: ISAs1 family transposase [unclassified Laspinema]MCT7965681.1 ISAs1 family transposase [Laspinema sp. D2a]MCT7973663.1 ISAs1 family transposase [Laspinema sp. D3d]MCT7996257.1 ISAs1 family transposase [Laspinema sp. D3c]
MSILIDLLKQVKDFRRPQGTRHPLWFILLIIILGLMNGHRGYRALGDFAKFNRSSLTKYYSLAKKRVPSYSTIRRVMEGINNACLIAIFNQWAAQLPPENILENWVAIDGKSIRSTVQEYQNNQQNFVSIVSAFCQEQKLVFSLNKLESKKESEIHCAREIVKNLPFDSQVLTLDALHCQKQTLKIIRDKGHDYLVSVKKNQPKLYQELENIAGQSKPLSINQTREQSHGRHITRTLSVFPVNKFIKSNWPDPLVFVQVERKGTRGHDEPYYNLAYYLCSRQENAQVFTEKIQGHWCIENQLHWPKDVVLQEDSSPIHQNQAATNLSVLKTIGMNLFRFLGFDSITEGQRWLAHRHERLLVLV